MHCGRQDTWEFELTRTRCSFSSLRSSGTRWPLYHCPVSSVQCCPVSSDSWLIVSLTSTALHSPTHAVIVVLVHWHFLYTLYFLFSLHLCLFSYYIVLLLCVVSNSATLAVNTCYNKVKLSWESRDRGKIWDGYNFSPLPYPLLSSFPLFCHSRPFHFLRSRQSWRELYSPIYRSAPSSVCIYTGQNRNRKINPIWRKPVFRNRN